MPRNLRKSRVRVRVEHVFGMMGKLAHESRKIFTKGLRRAEVKISLKNLTYNLTASPPFGKPRENCVPIKRNGAKITRKWVKIEQNHVRMVNMMI